MTTLQTNISAGLRLAAFQPDLAPNLGAMVRLAACAGIGLDIIEPCGFPFSLKALKRQALDYADKAEITRHADWPSFPKPPRLVLLSTRARAGLWDFRFAAGDTIMVGRESAGVPDFVHEAADAVLLLPMPGGGRSMNVAMTAAIAVYEALRQLEKQKAGGIAPGP